MTSLDFARLRTVVTEGPRPLFATVSGAHLYGFPSPDSDIDLRGCFVLPVVELLRMHEPQETFTIERVLDDIEVDWVAHDLRKFARLLTRRNGYVLEQLYSPLVVYGGPWLDELQAIGEGCITRMLYHHYKGFVSTQYKRLEAPTPTVKDLLYAFRVLLTGIRVLRTGQVEANLRVLSQDEQVAEIDALLARKFAGVEHATLLPGELQTHRAELRRLDESLDMAFAKSTLPDAPTTIAALDDFVVRARLEIAPYA